MTQRHPIGIKDRIGIWTLLESNHTNATFLATIYPGIEEGVFMMTEPVTIRFHDLETQQEALAIVRYDDSCVVIALSHREDGDIQVVMIKEQARKLLEALEAAVR